MLNFAVPWPTFGRRLGTGGICTMARPCTVGKTAVEEVCEHAVDASAKAAIAVKAFTLFDTTNARGTPAHTPTNARRQT